MGMLGSVVVILIGVLCSSEDLCKRKPDLRLWVDALKPFQGYLGMAGALYGLFLTVKMVAYVGFILHAPFIYLSSLTAGVVAMGAGGLLGWRTGRRHLEKRVAPLWLDRAEALYQRLLPHQNDLGYANLWLGVFGLLLNIFT